MEVYIHSFHGGIVTTVTTRPFMIGYNTQIFTFCRHSSLLLLVARTQGGATVTSEDGWLLLDCGLGWGGKVESSVVMVVTNNNRRPI